jgi:hypothetical protein
MWPMLSTAVAAWRNLVKRLSADWLILTAGMVTILFAMILQAAGPIIDLIAALAHSEGIAAVLATHDPASLAVADAIIELSDSEVAEHRVR